MSCPGQLKRKPSKTIKNIKSCHTTKYSLTSAIFALARSFNWFCSSAKPGAESANPGASAAQPDADSGEKSSNPGALGAQSGANSGEESANPGAPVVQSAANSGEESVNPGSPGVQGTIPGAALCSGSCRFFVNCSAVETSFTLCCLPSVLLFKSFEEELRRTRTLSKTLSFFCITTPFQRTRPSANFCRSKTGF